MTDYKLSVIIPTYNRVNFIAETLECILNQTLKPYEIIVVDQNSQDNTVEFLKQNYAGKIILIENKGNRAPGAGRNLGLKAATGDYIQFFDSDDVMTKNKFLSQVTKLADSHSAGIYSPYVMSIKDSEKGWLQNSVILQSEDSKLGKHTLKQMLKGFFVPLPAYIFKKELIDDIGFWREDIFAYEDYDYLFRMFANGLKPIFTNECCVFYRMHQNQITGGSFTDNQRDQDKIKCLKKLISDFSDILSSREIAIAKTQIHRVESGVNSTNISSLMYNITNISLRIENKINRLITKTDWQMIHKPNCDKQLFEKYKQML